MNKRYLGVFAVLLMMLLSGCIKDINPSGMTIAIPASQINETLQKEFPITQKTQYGKVTLADPQALLAKGSDRIKAGSTVIFSNALIPEQKGSVYVSGKPYFDAKTGNIYLTQPMIDKLDINGYKLASFMQGSVSDIVKPVINEVFRKIPIYKLNKNSIQGSFVKSVSVEDGSLLMRFGL